MVLGRYYLLARSVRVVEEEPMIVPIFSRRLFEFQNQFCRPFGVCYCSGRNVSYGVAEDQFMVPEGKTQVVGTCLDCWRGWKELISG